jgi:hypothetical protein
LKARTVNRAESAAKVYPAITPPKEFWRGSRTRSIVPRLDWRFDRAGIRSEGAGGMTIARKLEQATANREENRSFSVE